MKKHILAALAGAAFLFALALAGAVERGAGTGAVIGTGACIGALAAVVYVANRRPGK